jgi:peptidyl-prolyl cis-trans isomerase B (cyclophilin B)
MAGPAVDPIADVSVPSGKTLFVPVSATDTDGNPLTYTVSSDNNDVSSTVLSGGPFLDISVANFGDMTFRLFPEYAPNTVQQISNLVNSGFYNGLTFYRVVPNFVIQAGSIQGKPGLMFDDEFNPNAIYSGTGQLAMANSGKDTNGSEIFVSVGPQRALDFNNAIFGQLVRGSSVLSAIDNTPVSGSSPVTPVKITSAKIVQDPTDTVLLLKARSSGTTTFTVTASDGKGGTSAQIFHAAVVTDTTDDPPILGPVGNQVAAEGVPISVPLTSIELEGDPVTYEAIVQGTSPPAQAKVSGNVVTITPNAGFTGTFKVLVGVEQTGATSRGSTADPFDTQMITVNVKAQSLQAQGVSPNVVAGSPVGKIATFTAAVPLPSADFTATVTWGDGTTSSATVEQPSTPGHYNVVSTKAYDRFGSYPISVAIGVNGTSVSTTAQGTAKVSDSRLAAQFGTPAPAAGTLAVNGTIAAFADANPNPVLADLSATIAWGDGTTSAGTIVAGSNGVYNVTGSKTYGADGTYAVIVTITSAGGQTATAHGTIVVPNHAPVLAPIAAQTVQAGGTLTVHASGSDVDPGQVLTYLLGPGAPSGATLDPHTGLFTWKPAAGATSGTFTIAVVDNGKPLLSALQTFTATVTTPAGGSGGGTGGSSGGTSGTGSTGSTQSTPPQQPLVSIVTVNVTRRGRNIVQITLSLSGQVDGTSVLNTNNYVLMLGKRRIDLRLPQYNAAARTVTLVPFRRLAPRTAMTLSVNGLTDTQGRPFSAQGNSQAGGTFVYTIVPETTPPSRRRR